ncbi:hypothetical protein SVAN01_05588 [Stagonosporopsis vannaccii]|nr:hypothetical protein SVAN01_05588 [Stagonosporopsis vannaccii]
MRQDIDQLTSSSSRPSDTSAHRHAQHIRQALNNVPALSNTIHTQGNVPSYASLSLPSQEHIQSTSSERESPAYLKGKNPYGQILDGIDHPYRRPKGTGGAPSQIGASSKGRPRTSGFFCFKTRPEAVAEPELEVTVQKPLPPSSLPLRAAETSISVKAAKEFFDSKAPQDQSGPPCPYSDDGAAAAATANTATNEAVAVQQSRLFRRRSRDGGHQPVCVPSPSLLYAKQLSSSVETSMSSYSPESLSHLEPWDQVKQNAQSRSIIMVPKVTFRKVTTHQGSSVYDEMSSSDQSEPRSARRRSTNVFETAPQEASPLGYERCAAGNSSMLGGTHGPALVVPGCRTTRDCCCSVRRRSAHESTSVAEGGEDVIEKPSLSHEKIRRAKSDCYVRDPVEDCHRFVARSFSERRHFSSALTDDETSSGQRIEPRSC